MPGDKVQVLGVSPGEKESVKRVYYEGTDTIKNGYALCYNRDYGTAADVDWSRASHVEKPASGNLLNFAGLVTGLPSAGKTGPCRLNIVDAREGQVCIGFAAVNCVINATNLYVRADSYYLWGSTGTHVGKALQTDASLTATPGEVQMYLNGGF